MYMSSCEKKLNGYVNLKTTVGYQSTIIGEFACYILACLSSCLITEWLQLPHEVTSSCHRVSVYCTVSCFAGSMFTSMAPRPPRDPQPQDPCNLHFQVCFSCIVNHSCHAVNWSINTVITI